MNKRIQNIYERAFAAHMAARNNRAAASLFPSPLALRAPVPLVVKSTGARVEFNQEGEKHAQPKKTC